MARVTVRTLDEAVLDGSDRFDYFRAPDQPNHLSLHRLDSDRRVLLTGEPAARLAYVWSGGIAVAGRSLPAGSVVIAEQGARVELEGRDTESRVLVFNASSASDRVCDGRIHILPADRSPRVEGLGASGVGGTLFADGGCPSCGVWLHENRFPANSPPPADPRAGIHSHDESEIIFVTAGQMQLGKRLVGPGTAIAIEAGALYSFQPGDEGLTFVNFRAGRPGLIHFADGRNVDEVGVWAHLDRPLEYLAPQ
jgi:hypothetical protein